MKFSYHNICSLYIILSVFAEKHSSKKGNDAAKKLILMLPNQANVRSLSGLKAWDRLRKALLMRVTGSSYLFAGNSEVENADLPYLKQKVSFVFRNPAAQF
ncbi:hypothetical protein [Methanosarcina sp.]|uniref:hypothetical protein n=1 Tax=Methanosarcina sp. TaxID=2213 RepID=UPI003C767003